jgi:hypothetical protein
MHRSVSRGDLDAQSVARSYNETIIRPVTRTLRGGGGVVGGGISAATSHRSNRSHVTSEVKIHIYDKLELKLVVNELTCCFCFSLAGRSHHGGAGRRFVICSVAQRQPDLQVTCKYIDICYYHLVAILSLYAAVYQRNIFLSASCKNAVKGRGRETR